MSPLLTKEVENYPRNEEKVDIINNPQNNQNIAQASQDHSNSQMEPSLNTLIQGRLDIGPKGMRVRLG